MVRVGGGWDTLENYLNKHDPCRCNRHRVEKHMKSVREMILFSILDRTRKRKRYKELMCLTRTLPQSLGHQPT